MNDGGDQPKRLVRELDASAGELEGVERGMQGGSVVYLRNGREFVSIEGTSASFLLQPEVAAAALRTPGTSPSPRGRDWVTLDLTASDRFTTDRACAWLVSAWRTAGSRGRRSDG